MPPAGARPIGHNEQGDTVMCMEDEHFAHYYIVYPGYLDTWDGPIDVLPPPRFRIV